MKHIAKFLLTCIMFVITINAYSQTDKQGETMNKNKSSQTTVLENNAKAELTCKLTTAELQKRKETAIASLKNQVIDKTELENGFSFRFPG